MVGRINSVKNHDDPTGNQTVYLVTYRVIQEESALLWEMIV